MLGHLLSVIPLLANVALAAPALQQEVDKREKVCVDVDASTIFVATTVYITTSDVRTTTAFPQNPVNTITTTITANQPQSSLEPSSTTLAESSSTARVPLQPSSGIIDGKKWSNGTDDSTVHLLLNGTGHSLLTGTAPLGTGVMMVTGTKPSPTSPATNEKSNGLRNMVYFTNWGTGPVTNYQPKDLPTKNITHVLYAFGDISEDGTIISGDPYVSLNKAYRRDLGYNNGTNVDGVVKQLYMLKKEHRTLKTLLSVGGWTYSQAGKFKIAATEQGRKNFASSAVKLVADWGMDGLDIDWEYPENNVEAQNFVQLLNETRSAMDTYASKNGQKYHYLLTVATSAGPKTYQTLDIKGMDRYVDSWHLMAYDYAGNWDTTTGHQANIQEDTSNKLDTKFNTEQAVNAYTQAGVAPNKLVLGLPLYGHSFAGTDGLGKPYSGNSKGSGEGGIWKYRDLPRPGAEIKTDDKLGAAWTYDPNARELVTFDNVQTTKLKASYVKNKGLGGAFFWEASGDKTGPESLVGAMADCLGELDTSENMLDYPESQYSNIRNGGSV